MAQWIFSNDATTTLAAAISATSTSLQVTSGSGSLFPAIGAAQQFTATLIKNGNLSIYEIILVTGRSGDTFTAIARGQEGTTALAWNAGDTVTLLLTAAGMGAAAQAGDVQAQLGNYALDTGTANAYAIALTPALTAYVTGMPLRFRAAHTNTGASTLNAGPGVEALLTMEGDALPANTIVTGGVYEALWNGGNLILTGAHYYTFANIAGQVSAGQVPQAAVTQFSAEILASAALTGTPTTPTAGAGTATTQVASTAFVALSASLATSGYARFQTSAGLLYLQWGQIAYSGSGGTLALTFPTPFPNAMYSVVFTPSVGGYAPGVQGYTASGVTMSMNNLGGTAQTFFWIATGH